MFCHFRQARLGTRCGPGPAIAIPAKRRENSRWVRLLSLRRYVAEDSFDDAELLGFIVDHKIPLVTELLDVVAQNPDAQRVESAKGRAAWQFGVRSSENGVCDIGFGNRGSSIRGPRFRHELIDSFPHFARGLVGKGHTQDISGRDALFDHSGNAIRDDARLARARTGQDQDRTIDRYNGPTLLRVQWIQIQHARGV